MKKQVLLICGILLTSNAFAQTLMDYKQFAQQPESNFNQIVTAVEADMLTRDMTILANRKAKKQYDRWVYYWTNKVDVNGMFPNENQGYFNAGVLTPNGAIAAPVRAKGLNVQSWTNVGPKQADLNNNGYPNFPQMGRLNTLLRIAHPTDTNLDVLFVGAPNGGIWKSTDGGTTWAPKLDFIAGIGITDIKTVPGTTFANYTTQPIYVSTGDYDADHVKSVGVLKSTDGGETFNSTGLTFNLTQQATLGDLIVIDANTVFVGETFAIKKTTNGGTTWTDAYTPGYDATFGRAAINGTAMMFTGIYGDVFYTPNFNVDSNWTRVLPDGAFNKAAVTVGENGSFYIQTMNGQIRQFNSATSTFSNVGTIPPGYNSQQGYNQALVVTNNLILTGEVNGLTSTNNGSTWLKTLNADWQDPSSEGAYLHADNHRMGRLTSPLDFWSTHDGGLSYISYPTAASSLPTSVYKSSNVIVTQSYSVAINPSANDDSYLMSNQDNDAFSKINGTWYAVALGDGIQSAINYNNSNIRYASNQGGIIFKTDTGFVGQLQGNGSLAQVPGANFYFPLEIHKTNPNTLYAGGNTDVHILNGTTGLTIAAANSGLNGNVLTIASHGNSVMAATATAIAFSANQGATWSAVTVPQGAVGNITSVEYNASNNQIMYVTYSGYTATSKAFKTINGGTSWTNISGDMPNVVVNEILVKQNQGAEFLFAATELGVYFSDNGGTNWVRLGQNLPFANVRDIEIHYTADKLVAGTFGRGLWEINIPNSSLSASTVLDTVRVAMYPNPTNSTVTIDIENPTAYDYIIYNVIGGVVLKGKVTTQPIDVSMLAANVYMVRISNGQDAVVKKLIIK